jgi:predicted PurR-regulated permease PerM
MKYFLIVLMVIGFTLALFSIFNPLELKYRNAPEYVTIKVDPDSLASKDIRRQKGDEQWRNELAVLKSQQAVLEAQLTAYNKRIDDIFIFGGIIITLLLAIIASVYIKAEHDVESHFKKNFDSYRRRSLETLSEVQQFSTTAKTQIGMMQSWAKETLEKLISTAQEAAGKNTNEQQPAGTEQGTNSAQQSEEEGDSHNDPNATDETNSK